MNFEELKKNIDLEQFLIYCGYRIRRDKTSRRWPVYTNGVETVIVGNYGDIKLYQVPNADHGTIINFCFNRPELLNKYQGSPAQRVNQLLHDFLNLPADQKVLPPKSVSVIKNHPFAMPDNCKFSLCKNRYGYKFNYLRERGISDKTLHSPNFTNIGLFHDGETGFSNIAFPIYNARNEIQGYDRRGKKYKSFVKNSNKYECIWISDNMIKPQKIVIGESPIDMLSYHQMFGNDSRNILYFSINGNMGYKQIITILELICQKKPELIVSAFDNDMAGTNYTAKLIFSLMESQRVWPVYVDRYHQKLTNLTNIDFLNKITECPGVEIIPAETTYTLIYNNELSILKHLNQIAASCCKGPPAYIDIPQRKDWNEDLTKEGEKMNCKILNSTSCNFRKRNTINHKT